MRLRDGTRAQWYVDTGSAASVVRPEMCAGRVVSASGKQLRGASGESIWVIGQCEMEFGFAGRWFNWTCVVADIRCSGLIGMDLLEAKGAMLDCSSRSVRFQDDPGEVEVNSTAEVPALVEAFLREFPTVFGSQVFQSGQAVGVKHRINVGSHPPIRQQPYRTPLAKQQVVIEEVNKMYREGVIEPSKSPWSSPIVLVPKKDGTTRFCVDYRKLNAVTKKDAHPLPHIQDVLHAFKGMHYFCTLDLKSGYWQIPMAEEDKEKTAFTVAGGGLWQFRVMPFGLCNAVATFQRLMEEVLSPLRGEGVLVYVDDILVFGESLQQTKERVREVLKLFEKSHLIVKTEKCRWFEPEIKFLGHIIGELGVSKDPEKVKAVVEWPVPACQKGLRAFLGLDNYYRRFVKDFARIARPLHELTGKNTPFQWNPSADAAFRQLKQALSSENIVLAYPDVTKSFFLDVDACGEGVGAVLSQDIDGHERVVEYYSRSLTPAEKNYCITRLELLGLVSATRHFHHYLCGTRCYVRTDHSALLWLKSFKRVEGQLARWMESLQAYDLDITYRKGKIHENADSLSRRKCGEACTQCSKKVKRDSVPVQVLLADGLASVDWREEQRTDEVTRQVREWVDQRERPVWEEISGSGFELCSLWSQFDSLVVEGGLLKRITEVNDREISQLVVPKAQREFVLSHIHGGRLHVGEGRTCQLVKERFFWPRWRKDVHHHIRCCETCRQVDGSTGQRKQALKKYHAGFPWQRVMVDFYGPLPLSRRGNKYVLVFVDQFSKWVECIPSPDSTAGIVARILVEEIICRYGVPWELHSDQGRCFESDLLKHLSHLLGINRTRTTPYHPQSDGQVERFMRYLGSGLAKLTAVDQRNWDEAVPWIAYSYRATEHSATQYTPAEVFLGRNVLLPVDLVTGKREPSRAELPEQMTEIRTRVDKVWTDVRGKLLEKVQENHRYEGRAPKAVDLTVGQRVFVFDPARKVGTSPKLQKRWKGPAVVLEKLSDWVYRVRLGGREVVRHRDHLCSVAP